GEIIVNIDADKDVTLKDVVVVEKTAEIEDDADVQGRLKESQAQIYKIDLEHANKRKKKEDNDVMRYQALKRKPQTKDQARKNMMIYLRNMVRFKMDDLKGMSYDDIHPLFDKYFNSNVAFLEKSKEHIEEEARRSLKRTSESQAEKAAKKQKLDEEATPLARKVPIVDYEIYTENNKLYYKIIRADGSPQLFLNFLSLLRNFDREDLEVLWQLVKVRFASSKPKNFSYDFLLTTLIYMFEKPDVQAQVWKNQRSVHGLANVKSWRLLESCGVPIIIFTTTRREKAFGGITRDLGSFGEEMDKTTDLHQHYSRLCSQQLEMVAQFLCDAVTTHPTTASQESTTESEIMNKPII
nr:hypothetical protein [Tanacetum cinerariifolium]